MSSTIEVDTIENAKTDLIQACKSQNFDAVKDVINILNELGISIDFISKDGSTPLNIVCELQNLQIMEYLIEHVNADVNIVDDTGIFPMFYACLYSNLQMAKYLISHGANFTHINNILYKFDIVFAETIYELNEIFVSENNIFKFACCKSSPDIVKYLIDCGANVNYPITKKHCVSALHVACQHNRLDNVIVLVENGANVNEYAYNDLYPIHYAVIGCNISIVEYLISKGANIDSKGCKTLIPFLFACRYVHLSMIKYFVSIGFNIKDKYVYNSDGDMVEPIYYIITSYMWCGKDELLNQKIIDVFDYFVCQGVDFNITANIKVEKKSWTKMPLPLTYACKKNVMLLATHLISHNAKYSDDTYINVCKYGSYELYCLVSEYIIKNTMHLLSKYDIVPENETRNGTKNRLRSKNKHIEMFNRLINRTSELLAKNRSITSEQLDIINYNYIPKLLRNSEILC